MARVLVIDDQPHVCAAIKSVLSAKGIDVVDVNDGPSGLKEFEKSAFGLVIVDVYLPGMDGVKVIKALRARVPNLPIIAISGVLLGVSQSTALDMFPQAPGLSEITCLKKPFRAGQLLEAIEKALVTSAIAV
jgi:CheY-like chemotaxis protein